MLLPFLIIQIGFVDKRVQSQRVQKQKNRHKRSRPTRSFNDVCKHDLKSLYVGTDKWERLANDRENGNLLYKSVLNEEKNFF